MGTLHWHTLRWLSQSPVAGALGWTLLHSLWQAAVVAIILAMSRDAMRRASAHLRYVAACVAMVSVPVLAGVTFVRVYKPAEQMTRAVVATLTADQLAALGHEASLRSAGETEARQTTTMTQRLDAASGWLALAWGLGAGAMALRQLGGWMMVRRLRQTCAAIEDSHLIGVFEEMADRIGVRRVVALAESSLIQVPTVIGAVFPVVLLPLGAMTGLTPEQLRGLLAHELAHVRRLDYAANLVQSAIETLLFFNPAARWIGRIIR
ncbi:MAG: M56 family metallopeptidase, partial [Tepidisphaeraceae bacterium]